MGKHKKNKVSGITLIALVVTIIVLLILAGVSIMMLTGDNGILTRAGEARDRTEISQIVESAKLDILAQITENQGSGISKDELKAILSKYFVDVANLDIPDDLTNSTIKLTANQENGGYQNIPLVDIYNGIFIAGQGPGEEEEISKEESYVGCYADIDGNGSIDGVIYADLLMGKPDTGEWGAEDYSHDYLLPTDVTDSNVKDYVKSESPETDARFDSTARYVVKPATSTSGTKDRFYVMGLNNITDGTYWYESAKGVYNETTHLYEGTMIDYETYTSENFGTGKSNTTAMLTKWNAEGYGTKNDIDLWKWIDVGTGGANDGWFVPSIGEWCAFASAFSVTLSNYTNYHLSECYWSSSQYNAWCAWEVYFDYGYIEGDSVRNVDYVRLSTIF